MLAAIIIWPEIPLILPRLVAARTPEVKLGYFTCRCTRWAGTGGARSPRIGRRFFSRRLGFEEAFIGEHLTTSPRPSLVPDLHRQLARDTKRIKLGSGTVNLANRHPAATAAEIAMVDTLLEGRFILGVGRAACAPTPRSWKAWTRTATRSSSRRWST